MHSKQLMLCLLIAFAVVITLGAGVEEKKCAEFNEYCQNHWDCCSRSCASFRYRCTRNYNNNMNIYNNLFPYPFFGETNQNKESSTFEDIIALHFGGAQAADSKPISSTVAATTTPASTKVETRIDAAQAAEKVTTTTTTPEPCTTRKSAAAAAAGGGVYQNKEATASPQASYLPTNSKTEEPERLQTTTTRPSIYSNNGNNNSNADGIKNVVVVVDSMNNVPSENKCKAIGAKCYINIDCCTKRCHGYLHQCVT